MFPQRQKSWESVQFGFFIFLSFSYFFLYFFLIFLSSYLCCFSFFLATPFFSFSFFFPHLIFLPVLYFLFVHFFFFLLLSLSLYIFFLSFFFLSSLSLLYFIFFAAFSLSCFLLCPQGNGGVIRWEFLRLCVWCFSGRLSTASLTLFRSSWRSGREAQTHWIRTTPEVGGCACVCALGIKSSDFIGLYRRLFIHTEYKKARQEIKKKSSDTLKLQKKAKKGNARITSCFWSHTQTGKSDLNVKSESRTLCKNHCYVNP